MRSLELMAAIGFLAASLSLCRANLGETEAQCIARYGSESDVQDGLGYHQVGDKTATFHAKFSGVMLNIRVIFLNGRDCHEAISNADDSQGLSVDQMKAVLDSNRAGQDWHKGRAVYHSDRHDTAGAIAWKRDDGAIATFWLSGKASSQSQSGEMELSTKQYATAQAYWDKVDGNN
jgi:hypothetical protein